MARVNFIEYPDVYEPAARIIAGNAVYPFGHVIYESDTGKYKISDGKTPYNELGYERQVIVLSQQEYEDLPVKVETTLYVII